jgi:hypothetical protein
MTTDVKSYAIAVEGFPEAIYCGRRPSNARLQCYRAYCSYRDIPFREFLTIARLRRVPNPPGVGDRILVGGQPATRVLPVGQYVGFLRDDSDVVLCSHPNDVEPTDAR